MMKSFFIKNKIQKIGKVGRKPSTTGDYSGRVSEKESQELWVGEELCKKRS